MIYTAQKIREWDVEKETGNGWKFIPARPETFWSFGRFKTAWLVLIGRYDALDWQQTKGMGLNEV